MEVLLPGAEELVPVSPDDVQRAPELVHPPATRARQGYRGQPELGHVVVLLDMDMRGSWPSVAPRLGALHEVPRVQRGEALGLGRCKAELLQAVGLADSSFLELNAAFVNNRPVMYRASAAGAGMVWVGTQLNGPTFASSANAPNLTPALAASGTAGQYSGGALFPVAAG